MKTYGALNPIDRISQPADTLFTLLIAGSSGQAADYPVGVSSAGGPQLVRFTGVSTAGALLNFFVDLQSTKAVAPSSGQSTQGSSMFIPVQGNREFQIPGGSTGYSVAALSSGYVIAEFWRK